MASSKVDVNQHREIRSLTPGTPTKLRSYETIRSKGQNHQVLLQHQPIFQIIERDKDDDTTYFKIRFYNEPQQVCGKPGNLYRTNFESLFKGFEMNTGSSRNRDISFNVYPFSVDDSKNIENASLSSRLLRNGTHVF